MASRTPSQRPLPRFLQRFFGPAPTRPSEVIVAETMPADPADFGTAFGLDVSLAQQAQADAKRNAGG